MLAAVAQIDPKLGEKQRNLDVCLARLGEAAGLGASILVLPECAIPGYMWDSAEEHIDRLARKYVGQDTYPWRAPGDRRVLLLITPDRVTDYNLD